MNPILPRVSGLLLAISLACLFAGLAVAIRPLMPVDETRYVSVAWEMRSSGDYVVPHLNGATYSHKPPLLFWLINLAWSLFGTRAWTARMVTPVLGVLTLATTAYLARFLWPKQRSIGDIGVIVLATGAGWALFTTLTMFDTGMSLFVTLWMTAIYRSSTRSSESETSFGWFILAALAITGGILQKGPAMFLYATPIIGLARYWWPSTESIGVRWYARTLLALALGSILALLWVIPAAYLGGQEYANAILWKQSAGRIVHSFAHQRPFWWYLPFVPALLFPWTVAAVPNRAMLSIFRESSTRFCIAWAVPTLIAFSLLSGKQVHYLLPALPPFALLLSRLVHCDTSSLARRPIVESIAALLTATALLVLPILGRDINVVAPFRALSAWWCVPIYVVAIVALATRAPSFEERIRRGAIAWGLTAAVGHTAVFLAIGPGYDMTRLASEVADAQRSGAPVAFVGKYFGQFQFIGRLREPLEIIDDLSQLPDWLALHPNGYVVISRERGETPHQQITTAVPVHLRDLKANRLELWRATDYATRVASDHSLRTHKK